MQSKSGQGYRLSCQTKMTNVMHADIPRAGLVAQSAFGTSHWRNGCNSAVTDGMHCPCMFLPSPARPVAPFVETFVWSPLVYFL